MNIIAIIVAAVVCFVQGFLWFGPLFGKKWAVLNNKPVEQCTGKPPMGMMAVEFLNCLVKAAVFRWLLLIAPHASPAFPFLLAVLLAIAFSIPGMISSHMWASRPKELILIEGGSAVISLLLIAVVYSVI